MATNKNKPEVQPSHVVDVSNQAEIPGRSASEAQVVYATNTIAGGDQDNVQIASDSGYAELFQHFLDSGLSSGERAHFEKHPRAAVGAFRGYLQSQLDSGEVERALLDEEPAVEATMEEMREAVQKHVEKGDADVSGVVAEDPTVANGPAGVRNPVVTVDGKIEDGGNAASTSTETAAASEEQKAEDKK